MAEYSYPTIGEVIRFLFNSTGLLPQKHNKSTTVATEKKKKTIQMKLNRFAKEEGSLVKTYPDLMQAFCELLHEAVNKFSIVATVRFVVDDLTQIYSETLRTEGTFYSKQETIKYLLECAFASASIKAIHKNALIFYPALNDLKTPCEINWWLPTFSGGSVCWPLEKAFRWIYHELETNQSRFHNPSGSDSRASQNLENISRWFNRGRLPNWGELLKNFEYSVEQLANCEDKRHGRKLTTSDIDSFRCVLFFARLSTDIFQQIDSAFGRDFTQRLVIHMNAQNRRMYKFHKNLKKQFLTKYPLVNYPIISSLMIPYWSPDVDDFWYHYAGHLEEQWSLSPLNEEIENKQKFSFSEMKELVQRFNSFFVAILLKEWQRKIDLEKRSFMLYYSEGWEQRKSFNLSLADIKNYQRRINESGHGNTLQSMVEWMYATYFYRKDDHKTALEHYKKAFHLSKDYQSSTNNKLLASQLAESYAKNGKWCEFKKLVAWAELRGIEIPFCESEHETKLAFQILKNPKFSIMFYSFKLI